MGRGRFLCVEQINNAHNVTIKPNKIVRQTQTTAVYSSDAEQRYQTTCRPAEHTSGRSVSNRVWSADPHIRVHVRQTDYRGRQERSHVLKSATANSSDLIAVVGANLKSNLIQSLKLLI